MIYVCAEDGELGSDYRDACMHVEDTGHEVRVRAETVHAL